jgi:hypothetical protein
VRETDLYPPIKAFLQSQGYEVKAEIRDCDIVARRGSEEPVIVEMKAAFSLRLLLQGIDRLALSDTVYLAISEPRRKGTGDWIKLCRRLGLGLLLVRGNSVLPLLDPGPYAPRRNKRRVGQLLAEFARRVGDPNRGGSTRRPLVTAYRQDALRCASHIARNGASRVATIKAETGVAKTAAILQADVYGWFARKSRGIYDLTPKGREGLRIFCDVVEGERPAGAASQLPRSANSDG